MYSFYGGRPGNSFTIVTSFSTVQAMIDAFKGGPNYTNVHYDEYVIINTEDKNNPTNGQIYRRGYDYNNDMGGAELIGTIVGPAGKAPLLTMDQYSTIDEMQGTEGLVDDEDGNYISMKSKGQLTIDNGGLVPGKDGEDNFHDTIKWVSYSFRDSKGRDTIAHVGFQIPYPVIDFVSESGNFYEQPSVIPVQNEDEQNHLFYKKWKISIPKGQKGDSFQNFRVIIPEGGDVENYKTAEEMAEDIRNDAEILVYDYYVYNDNQGNPKQTPQKKTFYIGDYNVIKSVNVDSDGTLTVEYTHNIDQHFDNMIKWIENVTLADDGVLSLKYNNQEEVTNLNQIKWITGLYLNANGKLYAKYNYGEDEEITTSPTQSEDDQSEEIPENTINLKWIDDVQLSSNGVILIYYNNGEIQEVNNENPLKFIDKMSLSEDGVITVQYNTLIDPEDASQGNITEEINPYNPQTEEDPRIKWITGIEIEDGNALNNEIFNVNIANSELGKLKVTYNTGASEAIPMVYPTSIEMDETFDEENPQNQYKIKTTYSNGAIQRSISPINYIKKMLVSSNGHLLVQYTNYNQNIGASTTINNVTQDWADLGIVSPEAFGFNNSTTTITNKYLTGLLVPSERKNNYEDLTFSINVSQFLPKNLLSISITGCNITVYYSDNTSETILIDADHFYITSDKNIIISSNLFGIDFIFTNFSNKSLSEKTLVNILINSLNLAFDFDNSTEEIQSEIHNVEALTRRVNILENKTNPLVESTIPSLAQDISAINQIIPKSSITSYNTANKTIISDLNNINTTIGNSSEINVNNTGGSNIVNSLKSLKKPANDGLLEAYIINLSKKSTKTKLNNNVHNADNFNGAVLQNKGNTGFEVVLTGDNIIEKQPHGYMLQFTYYKNNKPQTGRNAHFQYYFIPKHIGMSSTRPSVEIPLMNIISTASDNKVELAAQKIFIKSHNASKDYPSGIANQLTTFIQGDYLDYINQDPIRKKGLNFALTGVYGV